MKRFITLLLAAGLLATTAFAGESCCKPQAACCQPAQACCVDASVNLTENSVTIAAQPSSSKSEAKASIFTAQEIAAKAPAESGDDNCCTDGGGDCCAEGSDCCPAK